MKAELKEQAIRLRLEQNLGYASIAKLIPVSKSTLSAWLKHYPLSEERIRDLQRQNLKNNEVKIERFRNAMRLRRQNKFEEEFARYLKRFAKVSRETRFAAGLMLYLAEGSKKDDYHITITNTDPNVINFFIRWLQEFFKVPKSSMRFQLQLYPTMDIPKEIEFWKNELGIQSNQFYKYYLRKLHKASFTYRDTSRHGICGANFSSSQKKREIMAAIKAFTSSCLK
ncbi:MAG: hypothetical protein A3D48_00140 [Candidatus Yanofskybacteria bacterium RIFCSPHIGHO2_02_FULL_43_17]|nr:MAG: hypothetical protein A3D48_00140 [Candidatus Yanofskybacteria bacterium RIFCSPHIGHO2_02_FULL_43_17]